MSDEDGPKVADNFYGNLFQSDISTKVAPGANIPYSGPDTTQAALALHLAVAKLRAEKCPFKRWVPFIHLGL